MEIQAGLQDTISDCRNTPHSVAFRAGNLLILNSGSQIIMSNSIISQSTKLLNKLLSRNPGNSEVLEPPVETDPQKIYQELDSQFVPRDLEYVKRTKNLRLLPLEPYRRGGKYSFAEWSHVVGIFQTIMYMHLEQKENNRVLDIGCGTGILGIAAEPFLGENGHYVGIDVLKEDIEFCRNQYPQDKYTFQHLDVHNTVYTPEQASQNQPWDQPDNSFDLVTALSVWTHMNEETAFFYFKEVSRVLKPGGKALITFFYLDEHYHNSLSRRQEGEKGRYHQTPQTRWVFKNQAYGSEYFYCVGKIPENAIGITADGMTKLQEAAGLKRLAYYPGNWKEMPGAYFQDVMVFQK